MMPNNVWRPGRRKNSRPCDHCGELYFPLVYPLPGERGYCCVQHRTNHQSVLYAEFKAHRAAAAADLVGPITLEEMATWEDEGDWP